MAQFKEETENEYDSTQWPATGLFVGWDDKYERELHSSAISGLGGETEEIPFVCFLPFDSVAWGWYWVCDASDTERLFPPGFLILFHQSRVKLWGGDTNWAVSGSVHVHVAPICFGECQSG